MQIQKRSWSDLSPAQQTTVGLGAVVELVLTTIAAQDLVRRPAGQVRGPKALWAAALVVQPMGPIAYLVLGRR